MSLRILSVLRQSFVPIILPFVIVPLLVAALAIGYVQHLRLEEHRGLLDQFNPRKAPREESILTDDDVMRRAVGSYGPVPTMNLLVELSKEQGVDCHNRAHQLGRMGYEAFGDEVLKLNLPECHSGFYHGAIEAYFKKNGTTGLKEKLSYICPKDLNTFFMHQCKHGLGHGLMAWSSYELHETLEYCGLIEDEEGRSSCRTGVFMENIIGSLDTSPEARSRGHITKYISSDPLFPCTDVKDEYKRDCYFLQTDRMLALSKTGFSGIVDACDKAPEEYKDVCFGSMGRTVGGLTRGKAREALAACTLARRPSDRIWCIDGVAKDTLWDPSGQDYSLEFCSLVPHNEGRSECYKAIFFHAEFVLNSQQLEAYCKRVPAELQDQCLAPLHR